MIVANSNTQIRIPKNISFGEAATMGVALVTVVGKPTSSPPTELTKTGTIVVQVPQTPFTYPPSGKAVPHSHICR